MWSDRIAQTATTVLLGLATASLTACGGEGDSDSVSSPNFSIGGTLSGLNGGSVVLQNNGGADSITLSANGAFTFANKVSSYSATVVTQPLGFQWCGVINGSGTATADVVNVNVTCTNARANVTTLAGMRQEEGDVRPVDGQGSAARFESPNRIAVDASGNLYVSDAEVIRKIDANGNVVTLAGDEWGGYGDNYADGLGRSAKFWNPSGVAVDQRGNVYVADTGNSLIRKIDVSGNVTTLAGQAGVWGHADGQGSAATFVMPEGIAVDVSGNVYVADSRNRLIRKIDASGNVTTMAGQAEVAGHADGQGTEATFVFPSGLAVDARGNLYVGDEGLIRKIDVSGRVTTLPVIPFRSDGDSFLAVDAIGNLYITLEDSKQIYKIDASGNVTTLAGQAQVSGHADGQGTEATFDLPRSVAVDQRGNVYVADGGENRLIRKITPAAP